MLGELAWMALRLTTIATAFVLVMTAFGIPRSPLVILAIPAAVLTGLAFAAPIIAYAATLKHSNHIQCPLPLRHHAAVSVLRRLLSPSAVCRSRWRRAAWFTPLFHGVQLVRGFALDAVPPAWPIHLACLTALVAAGIAMAQRTFRRRLYP